MNAIFKRKIFWVILTVACFIGAGFYYVIFEDDYSIIYGWYDKWNYDNQDRRGIVKDLLERFQISIDEETIKALKNQGLKDPVHDLPKDLFKNSKLIPYAGVLGGVMDYASEFKVLQKRYVWVDFEDGHIGGFMLLKFDIKNGKIKWKVLDSYLENGQ